MLLVLAASHDAAAARGVERLQAACEAAVLTPADLSKPGWVLQVPAGPSGSLIVDGERRSIGTIRGVLVRLGAVTERDVPWIHSEDRSYVAAEMTAFLGAWLAQLPVPVLNPPRGGSLCAPGWRPERWLLEATRAGLPTRRFTSATDPDDGKGGPDPELPPIDASVTLIAGDVVGGSAVEQELARRLAERSRCALVRAHFFRGRLVAADTWADFDDPAVFDAVVRWAAKL